MVLHNSFTFSLVFVMCFFVLHLHILMIFVLCFAGVAEAGFVYCSVEISRFVKFRNPAKFRTITKFRVVTKFSSARTVHLPPSSSSTTFRFLCNTLIFLDY